MTAALLNAGRLLALLLLVTARPAAAETLTIDADTQFRFAQGRYDAGRYRQAIAEFERFRFFFPSDRRVPLARWRMGMSRYELGQFPQAIEQFGRFVRGGKSADPELILKAQVMIAQCLVRLGQRQAAIEHLDRLAGAAVDPAVRDELNYQLGWLHIDAGRWELAEARFARIRPDGSRHYRLDELQGAMATRDRIPRKDPQIAGALAIVPGAGYLYCGRPRDALVALGANAALFIGAWEAFDNDQDALGVLLGAIGAGFYAGSIYGTVSSAHKFNRDATDRFRNRIENRFRVDLLAGRDRIGLRFSLALD